MATRKKPVPAAPPAKRPRRPTITVDLGEHHLQLLEDCADRLRWMKYGGLKALTRTEVIRVALYELDKHLRSQVGR